MPTGVQEQSLKEFDDRIMDPSWYADWGYIDTLRRFRDEDPVHWVEPSNYGRPFWMVTRHDDLTWCFANDRLLSNREGARMPRLASRTTAERRIEMGYDARLDYLDDPIHSIYRRPLNKHFSMPAVKRLSGSITSYVNRIIDELEPNSDFDFVRAVSARLPTMVIATLLGVPEEEWPYLQLLASRVVEGSDARYTVNNDPTATFINAYREMLDYGEQLILDRRKSPKDDFATVLSQLKIDHELFSVREARAQVQAMIIGGFDTTRHALSIGTWQMLASPDQRQALLDDPSLVMGAADESLRFANPARSLARVANEEFELRGKSIRTGDWVSLMVVSANRDERVFDNPLQFNIRRSPNEYLTFGDGVHKCLGRNLVKLELAGFFPILFSRMPELRIVEEPKWVHDTATGGLAKLMLNSGTVKAGS